MQVGTIGASCLGSCRRNESEAAQLRRHGATARLPLGTVRPLAEETTHAIHETRTKLRVCSSALQPWRQQYQRPSRAPTRRRRHCRLSNGAAFPRLRHVVRQICAMSLSRKHAHEDKAGGNSATSATVSAAAQPRLAPSAARESGRVLLPPTSSGSIYSIHISFRPARILSTRSAMPRIQTA
jgi:hypothetical protein